MNEESARAVTLLQAFEVAQPPDARWGDDDRAWATRAALEDGRPPDPAAFLERRARHAMRRLDAHGPLATAWKGPGWSRGRVGWASALGLAVGLLADSVGSSQHVNLLAPPMWAVLAWNAVVYLLLLGHALAWPMRRRARPRAGVRLAERLVDRGARLWRRFGGGAAGRASDPSLPMRTFASLWVQRSARLTALRVATLLHAASAALATGLIGGLYLRGLVLDFRAGWESTFLSAEVAHALLATVLGPASRLSGIRLPDLAAFEAMRSVHGVASAGASAAPWIHLMALTLACFVVLPRVVLALAAAARAGWLSRRFGLPLSDAYFQRLLRQLGGDVAVVAVQPYGTTPPPQAAAILQRLLTPVLGDALSLALSPPVPYGAEDRRIDPVSGGTTLAILWFDSSATPEPETQGRFTRQFAAAAPAGCATVVLVDETSFVRRFRADASRLEQRRDAWRRFAESLGSVPVFLDMAQVDLTDLSRGVQLAVRRPVSVSGE